MPGLQGLTREQIRVEVGVLLHALKLIVATSGGSTTTFLTDDLFGAGKEIQNRWLLGTGPSNNDGTLARIVTAAVTTNRTTLTVFPAWTSVDASDTAEVWEQKYNPRDIERLINRVIGMVIGEFFDDVEDITFHGGAGGSISRIDIPTTFEMLKDVLYRSSYDQQDVIAEGQVYDESVGAIFTVTQDTEHLLFGRNATKFVVSGAGDGQLAADSIPLLDISGKDFIEFPIEVDIAVAASDLVLRLSTTVNGADVDKIIAIPALTVGAQTWVRVAMTEAVSSFTPKEATAIISVALEYDANSKANTIWMGKIEATRNDRDEWTSVDPRKWKIDKKARDLVFFADGNFSSGAVDVGYSLIKLVGGDNPVTLDADGTVSELPEDWIINQTVALALLAYGDKDDAARAIIFAGMAATERANFPENKSTSGRHVT